MEHNKIATYQLTSASGKPIRFKINRLEKIYDANNTDVPHRHNYYSILLFYRAKGNHIIDFKNFTVTDKQLFFIAPGQVHQIKLDTQPTGINIAFTNDFLAETGINHNIINQLFNSYTQTAPFILYDNETSSLKSLCEQILVQLYSDGTYKCDAVGALLKLFFIEVSNTSYFDNIEKTQVTDSGAAIVTKFKNLVDQHYNRHHKVQHYASLLSITADYLNKTTMRLTGKSAKGYITDKLIIEARRQLLFTETTAKEMSFLLGFDEPAHFSNFFKKHTKLSPSQFRLNARKS